MMSGFFGCLFNNGLIFLLLIPSRSHKSARETRRAAGAPLPCRPHVQGESCTLGQDTRAPAALNAADGVDRNVEEVNGGQI
jgi:hypothetical protein